MIKLTPETITKNLGFIPDDVMLNKMFVNSCPNFEMYNSKCGRYSLRREKDDFGFFTNLSNDAWSLHIDNSDMQTIGNCDVEFVEQVRILMAIYKDY